MICSNGTVVKVLKWVRYAFKIGFINEFKWTYKDYSKCILVVS